MNQRTIDRFASDRLQTLADRNLLREPAPSERRPHARILIEGQECISFACNDYLGLSQDPRLIAAAHRATADAGTGAGASRLLSGNHTHATMLESRLARWKGTEDAVVFGSGYLANIGIVTALAGARDLICIDALAHSCLLSAAQLSRAKTVEFPHNDASALADLLQTHRRGARHCLVLTEGVFSMDGDRAPLDALSDICEQHDAWLLCDDAHGVGVLGDGRGTAHSFAPVPQVDLQMGTLSKGLGAYGGYVAASTQVCRYLRSRARSFVYSTAPPAGPLAAAATAIDIIEQEPDRTRRPLELARRFTADLGLPPAASAIVPLLVGASETALALARQLRLAGIYAPAIRPPTVPQGTARIRLAFSAAHSDADVQQLQQALRVAGYSA